MQLINVAPKLERKKIWEYNTREKINCKIQITSTFTSTCFILELDELRASPRCVKYKVPCVRWTPMHHSDVIGSGSLDKPAKHRYLLQLRNKSYSLLGSANKLPEQLISAWDVREDFSLVVIGFGPFSGYYVRVLNTSRSPTLRLGVILFDLVD